MSSATEARARRAAKRVGLIARRDNLGGFALLDDHRIVVGARCEPSEIIDLCTAAFNYGKD